LNGRRGFHRRRLPRGDLSAEHNRLPRIAGALAQRYPSGQAAIGRATQTMIRRVICLLTACLLACGGTSDGSKVDGGASRDVTVLADRRAPPDVSERPDSASGDTDAGSDARATDASTATSCDPDASAGKGSVPLGSACVPSDESSGTFAGSFVSSVAVSEVTACASGTCLVDHFQGRVTCPAGQSASGHGPDGGPGCKLPYTCEAVTVQVSPQCSGRTAADAVYCSCRCANAQGETNDGANYCSCPSTMTCAQVIAGLGSGDSSVDRLAGAYCVKTGTEWDGGGCP